MQPIHVTTLTRYRKGLKSTGCEGLLRLTPAAEIAQEMIPERDLTEVSVNTTLMEKAVIDPTGSKPCLTSLLRLNRVARAAGLPVRQSSTRRTKRIAAQTARYAHAKHYGRENLGLLLRALATCPRRDLRVIPQWFRSLRWLLSDIGRDQHAQTIWLHAR